MRDEEIRLRIGNRAFSWDEEKAKSNFHKHGVTFGMAAEVFFDDDFLEEEDSCQSYDETRFLLLGKTFSSPVSLLFVVFVERVTIDDDDVYRIISARKATKKERLHYEKGLWPDAGVQ